MFNITGTVTGQEMVMDQVTIVADTVDYLTAKFKFSPEWNDLSIWAHFTLGKTTYDVHLENGEIPKNKHLNLSEGYWEVYLHGTSSTGMRITTEPQNVKVRGTGVLEGYPLPDVPPTAAEQIDQTAEEAKRIAQSVRDDADSGKFDGKSPIIKRGYWWVWDSAKDEYVNTNVPSTGEGGVAFDVGYGLELIETEDQNILQVKSVGKVEQDNTLPITSAAVYTEIGNINAILETI